MRLTRINIPKNVSFYRYPALTTMTDSNPPPRKAATDDAEGAPPRYTSEQLFDGMRHVVIVHGTREYSLRLTATNKLILTA